MRALLVGVVVVGAVLAVLGALLSREGEASGGPSARPAGASTATSPEARVAPEATPSPAGPEASSAVSTPPPLGLVNLGDSFSAAVGTGGVAPSPPLGCLQGQGPDHVDGLDRLDGVVLLLDAACAGATTADVRAVLAQPAVAEAFGRADLVTLTLGGNDVGWTDYLLACSTAGEQAAPGACDRLLGEVDARVAAAAAGAGGTLAALDAATGARVLVIGYPHLLDPAGAGLFAPARAAALAGATDRLDAALAEAARAAGAVPVGVTARFAGHGAGSADPWLVLDPAAPAGPGSFHPTSQGYLLGYLPAVVEAAGL